MKPKHIILALFCLGIGYTAEAQFLKKLKKKAEQAAERTVLKKTDEIVTKKTEKTIDDATSKKETSDKKESKKETTKKQNNTKSTSTNNSEADLHLQNSVQPEVTELGGAVTFTIAVNNKGPATSNNIVSKIHIPSSYSITNISVTQGAYNQDTKLWDVGTLDAFKRAVMTVMVIVLDDTNLMTTGEIISCSTKDPDSTPNNGIDTNGNGDIIDDSDDEDDGDGQDVKIRNVTASNGNGNTDDNGATLPNLVFDQDVKMVLEDKKDKIISFLDFDTMAMRMEYHSKKKNPDPVYWDKDGYIYSADKGKYYKIPFEQVKNMGKNIVKMFSIGSEGMPGIVPKVGGKEVNLKWPNEPIIYNGYELHVYPNRYPMMEWVFIYHPKIFRGADDVIEETINCRGNSGCTKFTVTGGVEEAGSTVLFDSKDRLAEITNPDGASIIYTYEPCSVTLPAAESFNFNFGKN